VIGSGRDKGKPISKSTLYRHFRNEMKNGSAMLKALVMGRYRAALANDMPWAIQMGMRTLFRWDINNAPLAPELGAAERPTIQVTFVKPDPNHPMFRDDPLPKQIEQGPVRYDPAPPGQRLLPAPTQQPLGDLSKRRSWMD
jgi:hypothetical protein